MKKGTGFRPVPFFISSLLHKLRLQLHRPDAVDLAVDVVVAFDQTDVSDFGADLDHLRRTLDFQILDHCDGVAILQQVAVRILHHQRIGFGWCGFAGRPFMRAFGANQHAAVFVGKGGVAFGAVR